MMEISREVLGKIASDAIVPGEVYRMKLTRDEGVVPKNEGEDSRNKYFVVLGVNGDGSVVGFVLINTNVNRNIPVNLRKSHYLIKVEDYAFLEQNRYVCCGELKEIETTVFFNRFLDGAVGRLSDEHLETVKAIMAQSDNVPVALMKKYGVI